MDSAQMKRKLVAGALVLLFLVGGATEAAVPNAPSTDCGWMAALWDDVGRALGWIGGTWGRSEGEPPKTQGPAPTSGPDALGSHEEPPNDQPEMSPAIDPDG